MKKILIVLLLCGFAISVSAAKLDDFESYATGALDSVASPPWEGIPEGNANAVIVEDTGNKYINFKHTTTSNSTPLGFRNPNIGITEGQTKTLFFRVKPLSGLKVDHHVGLVDSTAVLSGTTSGSDWTCLSSWTTRMGVTPGTTAGTAKFIWRSSSASVTVLDNAAMDTWYNVWLVYYTATDKADMYVNTGTDSATAPGTAKVIGQSFYKGGGTSGNLVQLAGLAFRANGTMGLDDVYMADDVDLSNPAGVFFAHSPTPTNRAINIDTNSTLSWNTAKDPNNYANPNPAITKHYVYMREGDPNLKYITPTTVSAGSPTSATASCNPPLTLAMDKTYYWRVDESVNNSGPADTNTITGDIWSFVMQKSIPVFTQQPVEARALETDPSVSLVCKFTSISPDVVTWYKYVDGVNDTVVSAGGDIVITRTEESGTITSTLQINTPEVANQGLYYCKVSNDSGITVTSNTVAIVINRLLAQYDFDGTLDPAVGSEADAPAGQGKSLAGLAEPNSLLASNVTLAFETGVNGAGQAVVLDDPNQYVDFGTTGYPKAGSLTNGIGAGLDAGTILCWVKPNNTPVVFANYNEGARTGFSLSLAANSGTADGRIDVRGEGLAGEYQVIGTVQGRPGRPGWDVFDGAWHLLAVTWKAGGTLRIYVDGQQVNSVIAGVPAHYAAWQRGVLLGAGRSSTNRDLLGSLYGGAVDGLRIYNYERTADSIAQEYVDATGIVPCINSGFDGNAYNFDNTASSYCKIDMADFAVFAAEWLTCGLYPDCQ